MRPRKIYLEDTTTKENLPENSQNEGNVYSLQKVSVN